MDTKLLRNPTNIGDIFFSGSQTVKKGQQVTWILDDTWAFKATEDCGVSTNASPFVQLKAGQTFIIYKRAQEDIDAGNNKGIYIFDRDTVVALAYPQEVTQDIVIENDNYNNNVNNITIEANQVPTAKVTTTNSKPVINTPITLSGTSSYAVAPATIASYQWTINGAPYSTASSFTFTPTALKQYDVVLVVTDSNSPARKDSTSTTIYTQAAPVYDDIIAYNNTYKNLLQLIDTSWRNVLSGTIDKAGTGTIVLSASSNFWSLHPKTAKKGEFRVFINGVHKGYGYVNIPANSNSNFTAVIATSFTGSVAVGQTITIEARDLSGEQTLNGALMMGGSDMPSDQIEIKVTNRTS